MQLGAPHMRRRCYIIITKDMSKMKMIHPSYTEIWETQSVESMTKVKSMSETHVFKERCCLCGNSVVPACVVSAFNYLVHGTPIVEIRRDFNITLHDQTNGIMVQRKRWGPRTHPCICIINIIRWRKDLWPCYTTKFITRKIIQKREQMNGQ